MSEASSPTSYLRKFNGEVYEADVQTIASEVIASPDEVSIFGPKSLMLPRISVRTYYQVAEGRRRFTHNREVYYLGQFSLNSITEFQQHIEEDLQLDVGEIKSHGHRKIWVGARGNLSIPDSNLRATNLSVTIGPHSSSSTGYVIRGQQKI